MEQFYSKVNLVPYPKKVEVKEDNLYFVFEISESNKQVTAFEDIISRLYGIDFEQGNNGIVLNKDNCLAKEEYKIIVSDKIYIYYNDEVGLGYAFASLVQLISHDENGFYTPVCEISDYPDKEYRGLMLDLARKRHSIDVLYKYIDLCYCYKIKYLHLHFVDDPAYTLPSEVLKNAINVQGWCYSKKQLRKFCEYALEKNVEIIPEIEVPGHSKFLLTNTNGKLGDAPHTNSMCIAKESTFDTIKKLIDEVCELFPNSSKIHIGGDEVELNQIDSCEKCQNFIKQRGFSSSQELYAYFVGKTAKYAMSKGKKVIVWEGFSKEFNHYVPKDVIVSVFDSIYHQGHELLEEGFEVINASWRPLYITDEKWWKPEDIYSWNVAKFDTFSSRSPVYPNGMQVEDCEKLVGSQLCAWECDDKHNFPIICNSLPALSERLWQVKDIYGSSDFYKRFYIVRRLIEKLWL